MAELIPSNRFTAVLGPFKMEVINLAGTVVTADSAGNPSSTTQTGVDDADTVKTLMQGPKFAVASVTSDGVTINLSTNIAISGKNLTINNANIAADNLVSTVFGN